MRKVMAYGAAAVVAVLLLSGGALAQSHYDGLYRPVGVAYSGWACTEESVGRDGGAMAVREGVFIGVESECALTSPVNVRDMDAVLYDAVCSSEGEEYRHRLMLMKTKSGLVFVQDGFAFELVRCEGSGAPAATLGGDGSVILTD